MLAKDIMKKEVHVLKKEDTIEHAIEKLMEYNISGMPVVDENNQLVGILTETDIVTKSKKLEVPNYFPSFFPLFDTNKYMDKVSNLDEKMKEMINSKVEAVMTEEVFSVEEDVALEEIVKLMATKGVHRIPVVAGGKVVGIITQKDIIKAYANK